MSHVFPITFDCLGETLVGIVHPGDAAARLGVVIVVGGPQYRIGSHRQFVQLARFLAERGIPVMRFDVRGMGDSSGAFPGFEAIDVDIGAALDAASQALPNVRHFVLWGLCDAASAILFYAHRDPRVTGVVIANPWVRTDAGLSRSRLRHYYAERVLRRDFWRRLVTGDVRVGWALTSFAETLRGAFASRAGSGTASAIDADLPLPERMGQGFAAYGGAALVLISGDDLTAKEFVDAVRRSPVWARELARPDIVWHDVPDADHTFSRREWEMQVADITAGWLASLVSKTNG